MIGLEILVLLRTYSGQGRTGSPVFAANDFSSGAPEFGAKILSLHLLDRRR